MDSTRIGAVWYNTPYFCSPADRLDRVDRESAQFSCHTESFKWLFEFEPQIVSGVPRFLVIGRKVGFFLLGIYVRS